jgi:hypothetical protein
MTGAERAAIREAAKKVAAEAPPLSPEQKATLRALLRRLPESEAETA